MIGDRFSSEGASMKLVELPQSGGGKVYVNPQAVEYLTQQRQGDQQWTQIHFTNDHTLGVPMPMDVVVSKLEKP
jgi:hypothetical protein